MCNLKKINENALADLVIWALWSTCAEHSTGKDNNNNTPNTVMTATFRTNTKTIVMQAEKSLEEEESRF